MAGNHIVTRQDVADRIRQAAKNSGTTITKLLESWLDSVSADENEVPDKRETVTEDDREFLDLYDGMVGSTVRSQLAVQCKTDVLVDWMLDMIGNDAKGKDSTRKYEVVWECMVVAIMLHRLNPEGYQRALNKGIALLRDGNVKG